MTYIHRDTAQFSGWISSCRLYSARWVPNQLGIEVLLCWTQWTEYQQSLCMCHQNPFRGRPETFPLPKKSNTIKCFAYLRLKYEGCIYCRVIWWWKKTLRSSQDLNLGLLHECWSDVLTNWATGALALEQRIRWYTSIDTAQFSGWCSLYSARWAPKQLSTEVLHFETSWATMWHHETFWDIMSHHNTPWDILRHHKTRDILSHHEPP